MTLPVPTLHTSAAMSAARIETDSLGPVEVPGNALWGAQTQRSLHFFAIGSQRMPGEIIRALADIKVAAAEVNRDLGLLDAATANAIAAAATRIAQGELESEFPLSVWQTGSGTQSNMNVNEVIANLATAALGGATAGKRVVHPNDHVNLGHSSNDIFPSAMHLAAVRAMEPLLESLATLRGALDDKARDHAGTIKVGRTHLQDATPITVGQEFSGYVAQLDMAGAALRTAQPPLHALAIGGTAVGTGMNTHPDFARRVAERLAGRTGFPFVVAGNHYAAMAGHEALVALHAALRSLAISLNKIACDIRMMACGPRAGLGELVLPANEPGSSIMPGKVNPTQVEALTMVCAQVMGHDVAIGIAASLGQFELNAYKPLIALDVLDSMRLLTDSMKSFSEHCVTGIVVNAGHMRDLVGRSLMLVTALVPHVGYDRAAAIARHAHEHGVDLRKAAVEAGGISAAEFDAWVDPARMLGPQLPESGGTSAR